MHAACCTATSHSRQSPCHWIRLLLFRGEWEWKRALRICVEVGTRADIRIKNEGFNGAGASEGLENESCRFRWSREMATLPNKNRLVSSF